MDDLKSKVKAIIGESVGGEYRGKPLADDMKLVGNILDSMAVTKLVVALEESFGFSFDDEDLSAEAFETVDSLYQLVKTKVAG